MIIFFDGVCGLCNRFIDFVLRRDLRHRFTFAPLQGPTASRLFGPFDSVAKPSIILLQGPLVKLRTEAVATVLHNLGWPWKIGGWALDLLPRFLADNGYNLVAARRYRWFGRLDTCRLPTPDERRHFLP